MRILMIIVAAFITLVSCEEEISYNNLYNEAWNERSESKIHEYISISKDNLSIANGYFMLAFIQKEKHLLDSAINNYGKALIYFKRDGNVDWQAHTLKNMGNIHRENSNFKIALELYQEGLLLDASEIINHEILLKIARTNWRIDRWDESLKQLEKCQNYFRNRDQAYLAETNLIFGNISFDYFISNGNKQTLDEAFGFYVKAAKLYSSPENKAIALNNIGNTYMQLGKLTEARIYLDSALKVQIDKREIAILNHNLGKWHMRQFKFDSAIHFFNINIALSNGSTHEAQISYKALIDHYIKTKQTDLALQANERYFEKNQQLHEERTRLAKKTKEQGYMLAKQKTLIEDQQRKNDKQFLMDVLVIGVPSMLAILILIFSFIHVRRKLLTIRSILKS